MRTNPEPLPPGGQLAAPQNPGKSRLRELAERAIHPVEIAAPTIDPHVRRMSRLVRASEILRFTVLRVEHWLSPGGTLRECVRFNVKLALLLGIPAVLLTPIITLLLTSAVEWSAKLAQIARNLALVPAWVGTAVLIVAGIGALKRFMFGR